MNDERINVTKTFLPPIKEYERYIKEIWQSGQLTNGGQYVQELERNLADYLQVPAVQFVSNGTIALQLALKSIGSDSGEIITTPFSYVASTSAILWERFTPVYVDIDPMTFNIDAGKIEAAITDKTKAILAVHVFGNPCDVETIEAIAKKHGLKVIYDAAHAFGVKYKGVSLFEYGDISTCSFHATKLFHTIEGGVVVAKNEKVNDSVDLMKRFGHNGDEHHLLGINGKASELHAVMGLVNLRHIEEIIATRRQTSELYRKCLRDGPFSFQSIGNGVEYNYAYFPVVFESEDELESAVGKLNAINVYPRRYFYPSLNKIEYVNSRNVCPVSESIASRILCLPLYVDLSDETVIKICRAIS